VNLKLIILLTLIVGIGVFIALRPRIPKIPANLVELEESVQKLVDSNSSPGLSIAVSKDGEIVYRRGFGWADRPAGLRAQPETIYHWWSLTKIATAVAILQLHDQGMLGLDDPVSDHLPFFSIERDGSPSAPITIRQLLRHTSGLPDTVPAMIGWVHYEDELTDQMEHLKRILPDYRRLKFEPDAKSAYSNLGYMVLGAVIESVSGEKYESYVRQHVLNPLGMTETSFLYTDLVGAHVAAGSHPLISLYTPLLPFLLDMGELVRERKGARYWFNPVYVKTTPPSGLLGSVNDAALLAQALLARDDILSTESHSLMIPEGESPMERPLGWAEYNLTGRMWVQHQGGGPGFTTLMRLYPEENLGIVLMANSTHLPSSDLANAIATLDW
jgi:CubicO group peptidase (beta-lactamase class C family)